MTNQPLTLASLSTSLIIQNLPLPHPSFLRTILTPTTQTQPLPALTATARHRLLSADISSTTSPILSPSNSALPATLPNTHTIQTALANDIFVQVLDVVDLGSSKWEQIEALESVRRGEGKRGREVIRLLPSSTETNLDGGGVDRGSTAATQIQAPQNQNETMRNKGSAGPNKILLQDMNGMKIWGFELKRVNAIGISSSVVGAGAGGNGGMSIGCKIWLKKGCKVARGLVLLEPGSCVVVGGKIEGLDKAWREGREQRLREEVMRDRADGGGGDEYE